MEDLTIKDLQVYEASCLTFLRAEFSQEKLFQEECKTESLTKEL
jgi:hypothetical protein